MRWNTDWAGPPQEDLAALGAYRRWALERWGVQPAQTGIEALGLEAMAAQWTSFDGPAEDSFSAWLSRPGTLVGS